MNPLVFENVSHGYGGVAVLSGIDLVMAPGVLGVLGNNGAGKSTFLKLAAGLVRPERGTVRVYGAPTAEIPARLLSAYLPEEMYLDELLTPIEFLTFVGEIRAISDAHARARRLLERLGGGTFAETPARDLSFGMRRKTGIAAAFLAEAPLTVLDEPGNGLDVASLAAVETLIGERVAQGGSVVLSSHDMGFVARVCRQLMLLFPGGGMRVATPQQLIGETGAPDLHHAFRALAG